MATTTARVAWQIFASLTLFIMGIATGVMLTQVDPRSPNFAWIETLQNKSAVVPLRNTPPTCPPVTPNK